MAKPACRDSYILPSCVHPGRSKKLSGWPHLQIAISLIPPAPSPSLPWRFVLRSIRRRRRRWRRGCRKTGCALWLAFFSTLSSSGTLLFFSGRLPSLCLLPCWLLLFCYRATNVFMSGSGSLSRSRSLALPMSLAVCVSCLCRFLSVSGSFLLSVWPVR